MLVSLFFEPSQPLGIISGLKTKFNPSLNFSYYFYGTVKIFHSSKLYTFKKIFYHRLNDGLCTLLPSSNFIGQEVVALCVGQYHWTNKHHVDHWYDSSGLTLYYTPRLRPNDAGAMVFGQHFLEIPPGVKSFIASGSCSSDCTQKFMYSDINIISALNHMHYLG